MKHKLSNYLRITFLIFFTSQSLTAQLLEGVLNPGVDASLKNFVGGQGSDLFFAIGPPFDTYVYHYDGNEYSDTNPGWFFDGAAFLTNYKGFSYLAYYFDHFELFKFDNDANILETVVPSADYETFEGFVGAYNDLLFFRYKKNSALDAVLVQYDGNINTIIPNPPNKNFSGSLGLFEDKMLLIYSDSNYFRSAYTFNGDTLLPISGIPTNTRIIEVVHQKTDKLYLNIQDENLIKTLYTYSNDTLVKVESPENSTFVAVEGNNSFTDEIYITFQDTIVNVKTTYIFDESSFTPLPIPGGYTFSNITNVFQDITYMLLEDDTSLEKSLFKWEAGIFEQVNLPEGFIFKDYIIDFGGLYYVLEDTNSKLHLSKLNLNTNSILIIPGPGSNFHYNNYHIIFEEKMFFEYEGNMGSSLLMYDGNDFIEVKPDVGPNENPIFKKVLTKDSGILYLSYEVEGSFLFGRESLYKLLTTNGIPTSQDIELITLVNSTYNFDVEDFAFFDTNLEDSLHSIVITEVDQKGDLILGGEQIVSGDTILAENIGQMSFTPPMDETGTLTLQFKVGDGQHYSTATYELTLVVVLFINTLPTSEDNSISTFVNMPYNFDSTNFSFTDADDEDTLHSILITELSDAGTLLSENQAVQSGDTITATSITDMSFIPPVDEEITTSFRFKVGDGKEFSEQSYQMEINVIQDTTSTIDGKVLNAQITINPNPARKYTNLRVESTEIIGDLTLILFNTQGRTLQKREFESIGNSFYYRIELDNLVNGYYYLFGYSKKGRFIKSLVVDQ